MPQGIRPIGQREKTITRSVARDAVKSLIEQWGFPKDSDLIFNELQGAVRLEGGMWKPCETKIKTDYRNYVFIDYRETFMDSPYNRDVMTKNQHLHLFQDREVGFYAIPKYVTVSMELNLRFRSKDLTEITRLRNYLKMASTERRMQFSHDLFYDYNIPDDVLYLATLTHALREKIGGSGISLKDYLKTRFKEGVTIRSNATGTKNQPICQECQRDVVGRCEEESPFNVIEINEDTFEVAVPYRVDYRQPVGVEIQYPIIVHNQFVGNKVINLVEDQTKNVSKDKRTGWAPLDYMQIGKGDIGRYYRPDGGKRLVEFDEWYPDEPYPNTVTLCIAPVTVDPNDNKKVADLIDLPDSVLSDDVKEFLMANIKYGGKAPMSLIHVEVFETYDVERSLDFTIDANLSIRTLADLDPRYRLHVRVSINEDWATIPNRQMHELLGQPELCHKMALLIDSKVKLLEVGNAGPTRKKDTLIVARGRITTQSMRDWLVSLPKVNIGFKRAPSGFMSTVQGSNITVTSKGVK